ncbi:MAG: undecaprenyldiphospho-muramoylpentapeptide beta-N-acetylglucosaminyltransferase [Nitrospirae bacterium]|nr:MAG: undecaprenyldiphospho-muramoylpentapeptide beta-N-acetylglucosaminyltransferase [Nitrospirota bacterium]
MNVVIAAGGTGGHLAPALALAEEFRLQCPSVSITMIGTGKNLERMMLARTDLHVETLPARGVVGRRGWSALAGMASVPKALWKALHILRASRTALVIGTGGYTSLPVILAGVALGIPRAVLEPNVMPGVANRIAGPMVHRVFLAWEEASRYFPRNNVRVVGTPLRRAFTTAEICPTPDRVTTLLICGGSQGAKALNTAVVEALTVSMGLSRTLRIIHQTGVEDYERIRSSYEQAHMEVTVVPFLQNMPEVLREADLVISRCGAVTLAELTACGKPAILVPFPHATHQHQDRNARVLEQAGAAVVIPQDEQTGSRLAQVLKMLVEDPDRVNRMVQRSWSLRRVDAAQTIVRECRLLVGRRAV